MKATFANKKSQSFSNFDKNLHKIDPTKYKMKEQDTENFKELIQSKRNKFDIEKPNILKSDQENLGISKDHIIDLSNTHNNETHKSTFYLLDQVETFPLPNQILPPIENFEKGHPKHDGDTTPPELSSIKLPLPHKKSLNVVIDHSTRINVNEQKRFPMSATLPMKREISDLLEQLRKRSNQQLESPTTKINKSESNLNQNCLVCFDKPPNAVFMNCGHGGLIFL